MYSQEFKYDNCNKILKDSLPKDTTTTTENTVIGNYNDTYF